MVYSQPTLEKRYDKVAYCEYAVLNKSLGLGRGASVAHASVWPNGHQKDVRRHDGRLDTNAAPMGSVWPRARDTV